MKGSIEDIKLLKNRNMALLWTGFISAWFGNALIWMVLVHIATKRLPEAASGMSMLIFCIIVPMVAVSPIVGAYVELWDKKRTITTTDILRGLLIAGFFISSPNPLLASARIYLIALLISIITQLSLPFRVAMIPETVKEEDIVGTNVLFILTDKLMFIVGLGIAGLIVAKAGVANALRIAPLAYSLSALTTLFLNMEKKSVQRIPLDLSSIAERPLDELIKGIGCIIKEPIISFVVMSRIILMAGIGVCYIFLPVFVEGILKGGAKGIEGITFIQTALGIGVIAGLAIWGRLGRPSEVKSRIKSGLAWVGVMITVFAFIKSFWLSVVVAAFAGVFYAFVIGAGDTMLNFILPQLGGGILDALQTVINAAFAIVVVLMGFVVSIFEVNVVRVTVVVGIVLLLAGVFMGKRWKLNEYR